MRGRCRAVRETLAGEAFVREAFACWSGLMDWARFARCFCSLFIGRTRRQRTSEGNASKCLGRARGAYVCARGSLAESFPPVEKGFNLPPFEARSGGASARAWVSPLRNNCVVLPELES